MTDGTEKPQIPWNKILYCWLCLTIFQLDLHNVMIPYLYPLENWFATYFELACLDLDL